MQTPSLLNPPPIILATDDARLRSKAERLFGKSPLSVVFSHEVQEILRIIGTSDNAHRIYVCIDLDAKSFQGYELAREVKELLGEASEGVTIIGAAFGIEPAVIQQTKLYRIDALLQRFALEKLLRTLAEGTQEQAAE